MPTLTAPGPTYDPLDPPAPVLQRRLASTLRHVAHVRENCERLASHYLGEGEPGLAVELLRRGLVHDASKLAGVELAYLHQDVKASSPFLFNKAVLAHHKNNDHHPEHWPNGADDMPDAALAEMAADWHARSAEFGTDLLDWVGSVAASRYGLRDGTGPYRVVRDALDVLLDGRF